MIQFFCVTQLDCADEEEESLKRAESAHLRSNSSDEDLEAKDGLEDREENDVKDSTFPMNNSVMEFLEPKPLLRFGSKLTNLQIPSKEDFIESLKTENHEEVDLEDNGSPPESPMDGYEKVAYFSVEETQVESFSQGSSVLERINSAVKGTSSSYQLGKQLSCKWSTGAGPRIGCVREYPSELQCQALEQVNLSPRSARCLRLIFPGESTPTRLSPLCSPSLNHISKPCRTRSSPLCT